jgi:hypothetical protein
MLSPRGRHLHPNYIVAKYSIVLIQHLLESPQPKILLQITAVLPYITVSFLLPSQVSFLLECTFQKLVNTMLCTPEMLNTAKCFNLLVKYQTNLSEPDLKL